MNHIEEADNDPLIYGQINKSTNSKIRYRLVWVENPISNRLVQVEVSSHQIELQLNDSNENKIKSNSDTPDSSKIDHPLPLSTNTLSHKNNNDDDDIDSLSIYLYIQFTNNMKILFVLIQGILAGFSFASLYIEYNKMSDWKILNIYQTLAQNYRRFFYILIAISLVGSLDNLLSIYLPTANHLSSEANRTNYLSAYLYNYLSNQSIFQSTQILAIAVTLTYLTSFIITLTISPTDVLISDRFGYYNNVTLSGWEDYALSDPVYSKDIKTWKYLSTFRVILCVFGWFGSCYILSKDYQHSLDKSVTIARLTNSLDQWRKRSNQLEGEDIEDLESDEIKKLIDIQEIGIDRTKAALEELKENESNQ